MKPVVAVYSTFMQRAYDQMLTDVCLQNLPVVFCIDRAGNVGNDGETHHGVFDLSYLSHMPNLKVLAPMDGKELEMMLEYALGLGTPVAIRYPRGYEVKIKDRKNAIKSGAMTLSKGEDVEIWAVGKMVRVAEVAKKCLEEAGISVGVVNARFIKPIDGKAITESARRTKLIVTLEDNVKAGGFGEKAASYIKENALLADVKIIAWPDRFIEHGSTKELFDKYGFSPSAVSKKIQNWIAEINKSQ
ncbi:MAG: transketolase C-terminal domain-containing protein, partial [Anaerovoracaceae bacterium]